MEAPKVDEAKFQVVLKGYGSGKGEYYIEKDFAELFKLPQEKVKVLFKNLPKILKENLTKSEAEKYQKAISKTGADCDVVDNRFDFSGLSVE
jgi:ribosomal protein L7/L12